MQAIRAIGTGISTLATRVAIVGVGVGIGIGVPALWIWIGSHVQSSTAPSWTALVVVHVGLIFTLLLIASTFSFLITRSQAKTPDRSDWMRGISEERRVDSISDVHPLELILFLAVFIDIIAFVVWFFAFGDPGTPVGQG
jgi:phosphotransferase system  glucose/maltose/N-acetylglucosamine-specific IIC component